MVRRGFNINGPEEDDLEERHKYQDLLDRFYRVGKEKLAGTRSYPRKNAASFGYDEEYLDKFFKGTLFTSALHRHPDIPPESAGKFLFDSDDFLKAVSKYHSDARQGMLPSPLHGMYLHEFLWRQHNKAKQLRFLSPFLYYYHLSNSRASYDDLPEDDKSLVDYVVDRWSDIPGARPIVDKNEVTRLPEMVYSFVSAFYDIIPLQQRYGVHNCDDVWPISCCEMLLDDFLDCVCILADSGGSVSPGLLTSKKMWGGMFMKSLRGVTGLGEECLPNWTDINDVDTSNCWCTGCNR